MTENNSNRWFFKITKEEYKNNKKNLIKFIIRAEEDGDDVKFKSIFKNSGFCKKNDSTDRDKVSEYEFYTMDYDNTKSKDMLCNHSVCYTTKDEVSELKNTIKFHFPDVVFKNSNSKTISLNLNPKEYSRGKWIGKNEDINRDIKTQYPICIVSYKRANEYGRTHKYLTKCNIPHYLFVESDEYSEYEKWYDNSCCCLVRGENFSKEDMGSTPMRNYILDYHHKKSIERVWILDDNIKNYKRLHQGVKNDIYSVEVFKSIENYIINYENVGLVSHNFNPKVNEGDQRACIVKNGKCFSSMLVKTDPEIRFRYKHQEDHLISMEYIEKGYSNLCFNNVVYDKNTSGMDGGGNREGIYQVKDKNKDGNGYKERYEFFENIILDLYNDGKLTLIDGITTSSLLSRSKTMKSKEFHAEVNYKMLANNKINKINKISNVLYKSEFYFVPNQTSETSSEVSTEEEEETSSEISTEESEPELILEENDDCNIKFIIDEFKKRKQQIQEEELELIKRFPNYFN